MSLLLKSLGLPLLVAVAFVRCAALKEVNSFALASHEVLEKNRSATFGYYSYSKDSAFIFHYLPDHLRDVDCHCDVAKQADAHIASEYSLLGAYFGSLAKFADPHSSFDLSPMATSLLPGTYGPFSVTLQEYSIASKLTMVLSGLATPHYKARHIPAFMAMYRDSVAPLITLLKIRADNYACPTLNLQF